MCLFQVQGKPFSWGGANARETIIIIIIIIIIAMIIITITSLFI